jgi:Kef-type K+ transport system membrane component KefB/nucleotide-binding universal stress UspA family protein
VGEGQRAVELLTSAGMTEALRPIGGHSVFILLVQLALLLLVARLGAELCRRIALPAVIGELAAGIVLGPTVLGHFAPGVFAAIFPHISAQFQLLEVVGLLGMVLLLLLTGLETDLRLLRNLGRAALIASAMGMLLPFVSGFVLGTLMPEQYLAQPDRRTLFSFFLATAMAISAMPVIAKILMDLDLARRNIGLVILSAGVVDDTAGWLVLSIIAGAASHGEVRLEQLGRTLLLTGGFVLAAAFVVYPLSRVLMRGVVRRAKSDDADLVLVLIVTFLCAAATEWVGIHAVFGAFVAGTLFRQIPALRTELVHRLQSLVFAVLAPVFFGTVGLKVDLWTIGGGRMLAVVLAVACIGKLLGCTVGSIWGGLRFWEGLSIAVAMNARGAMELVVATIGLSLGILNQQMFSMIVVVAIVTSFMAPIGLRLTMRKVRMTEEEARRILAEQSRGVFDLERMRVLVATAGGPNELAAGSLAAGISQRSAYGVEVVRVEAPRSWRDGLLRLLGGSPEGPAVPNTSASELLLANVGITSPVRELKRPDVGAAIVEEARKGFQVVFMGASRHGLGLGGEVLETVVEKAPCHLVIVKSGPEPPPHRRLLVPYDGGMFSRVAVEFAARYAELTSAALTIGLLSDRGGPRLDEGVKPHPGGAGVHPGDATLNRISPVFHALTFRPEVVEIPNDPFANAISAEARSGKYDLVVIGSENRAVQHRLFFGRDNERLIREAPVSVAIVIPNVTLLR